MIMALSKPTCPCRLPGDQQVRHARHGRRRRCRRCPSRANVRVDGDCANGSHPRRSPSKEKNNFVRAWVWRPSDATTALPGTGARMRTLMARKA